MEVQLVVELVGVVLASAGLGHHTPHHHQPLHHARGRQPRLRVVVPALLHRVAQDADIFIMSKFILNIFYFQKYFVQKYIHECILHKNIFDFEKYFVCLYFTFVRRFRSDLYLPAKIFKITMILTRGRGAAARTS